MKNLTLKNAILTILQWPVTAALRRTMSIQFMLTKCLARIDNPLSSPFADLARWKAKTDQRGREGIEEATERKVGAAGPYSRREVDLRKFENLINWLKSRSDEEVNSFREKVEATMVGCLVVEGSPERHLYAVLAPTKEENLRRIEKVFNVLPLVKYTAWLVEIEMCLGLRLR